MMFVTGGAAGTLTSVTRGAVASPGGGGGACGGYGGTGGVLSATQVQSAIAGGGGYRVSTQADPAVLFY